MAPPCHRPLSVGRQRGGPHCRNCPNNVKFPPRLSKSVLPKSSPIPPKILPNTSQDPSKINPGELRSSSWAAFGSQEASKSTQEAPKRPPRDAQERPRAAQERPRTPQNPPKSLPNPTQEAPISNFMVFFLPFVSLWFLRVFFSYLYRLSTFLSYGRSLKNTVKP